MNVARGGDKITRQSQQCHALTTHHLMNVEQLPPRSGKRPGSRSLVYNYSGTKGAPESFIWGGAGNTGTNGTFQTFVFLLQMEINCYWMK